MKALIIGVVLVAAGVLGLVYKGFSYNSTETVAKIGNFEASAEVTKEVGVPKALSIILIVAGAGFVLASFRK